MSTRFSLFEALYRSQRRTGRKGLALLDVLAGIAIFGMIAAAAVIGFGQFRQNAYQNNVINDARNIALKIEAEASSSGGILPQGAPNTGAGAVPLVRQGLAADTTLGGTKAIIMTLNGTSEKIADLSSGNRFTYTYVAPTATTAAGFVICIAHFDNGSNTVGGGGVADAGARYESLSGGITQKSDNGQATGCTVT